MMIYYKEYNYNINEKIEGKRKIYYNNIFTLDIETTSIIILNFKIYPIDKYIEFSDMDKEKSRFQSFMYIWQISIDNKVVYGRTHEELKDFMSNLNSILPFKKYFYVHNLSYEFQFLCKTLQFTNIFSRKSRKVIRCESIIYNSEFRCSLYLSNVSLDNLSEFYKLPIKKLKGNLDYNLIRHSKTNLSYEEMCYCENDCLVLYYYIKKLLEEYKTIKNIPLTSTGILRKEFQQRIEKDYSYKKSIKKSINNNPEIYNRLVKSFMGGYTHSNFMITDFIIKNVTSYDFTSSYPYVMLTEKYPSSEFKECMFYDEKDLIDNFCYILEVEFFNLESKTYNHILSKSFAEIIENGNYDNGRVITADYYKCTCTDIDFKLIRKFYKCEYKINRCFYSTKKYLHKTFIEFILEKYKLKTEYKGIKEKEIEYMKEKNKFNSLYGMSVTNNIRDNVYFDINKGWYTQDLTNDEIIEKLEKEKTTGFFSFSMGVWVTAYARKNLLELLYQLDDYVAYSDTDSLKLINGYDENIINDYNKHVDNKIKNICDYYKLDKSKFNLKDIKGRYHKLGIFEKEETYQEFVTLGAKKYAYRDSSGELHITVSGVPKTGVKALKNDITNFKDNLIFEFKDTNKHTIVYNDNQDPIIVKDYLGVEYKVEDERGAILLPAEYKLGKAFEYSVLLNDFSEKRNLFKEGVKNNENTSK